MSVIVQDNVENVNVLDTLPDGTQIIDLDTNVIVQPNEQIVQVRPLAANIIKVVTPGISQSSSGGSGIVPGDTFEHVEVVANLSPGGSHVIDCDVITNNKVGRLWMIDFSSSAAIKLDVEFINGSRVKKATVIKGPGIIEPWGPPDPRFMKLDGDGAAKFGCTVTNLSIATTSDIKVTIYYDEVDN